MANQLPEIKTIMNEQLKDCTFQPTGEYFSNCDVREHNRKVNLSILLRNRIQGTVRIIFNTIDGYKELKTTVWGSTDNDIMLKGGNIIPVEAVAYVTAIHAQALPILS